MAADFSLCEPIGRGGGLIGSHDVLDEPSWNDDGNHHVNIVPGILKFLAGAVSETPRPLFRDLHSIRSVGQLQDWRLCQEMIHYRREN